MIEVRFSTHKQQSTISHEDFLKHLHEEHGISWIDVDNPTADDLRFLEHTFGFHPLALEDTINQKQRPKAEEFEDHLFIIVNAFDADYASDPFQELDIFVGKHYFVTLHTKEESALDGLGRRIQSPPSNFTMSTTFLLYALLDEVVDGYQALLERTEDDLQQLSSRILQNADKSMLTQLFATQQLLGEVNRILLPHLDILKILISHELVFIEKDSLYHLRDISDHLLRSADLTRQLRDTTSNLLNLYVSAESNQFNKNITRLTLLTITIGTLTIISGFYGMNFTSTFPPFSSAWGVPFVVLLMALVSSMGFILYKRQ